MFKGITKQEVKMMIDYYKKFDDKKPLPCPHCGEEVEKGGYCSETCFKLDNPNHYE
jgi:hypothetical protein